MREKAVGSVLGALSLLVAAGGARGQPAETAGATAGQSAPARMCRDAGVTVAFKTSSAELDQNAQGGLDGVATWMKEDPTRTLHLEGFADTTGDSASNLALSADRAEAVKAYLVAQGVDATKVVTVGRGEESDHLPANGRAVTFLACAKPGAGPMAADLTPEPSPVPPGEVTLLPPRVAAAPVPRWSRGFGWAVMAGGAYQDFTSSEMRSATNGGGAWDARFIGGTNSIFAFEAAYVGAARQMNALGITGNQPTLVSNGLEGTFRLNAPIRRGASLFEPYGYVGLGWAHYGISNYNSNAQTLSSFTSSDDIGTVPVGGGFAYAYKAFIADARAGWTGTYGQDLLINGSSSSTLNHWNVGGQIGFRF